MSLVQFWNIIWQNEPFHWVTAFLFVAATLWEAAAVLRYWQQDCGTPKILNQALNNKKIGKKLSAIEEEKLKEFLKYPITEVGEQFVLTEYPSILNRAAPRSTLRFIPTILTAIGVLGTFYGIQVGLQDISPTLNTSQELLNSSKNLFDGMKTAFSTSLMGLGSSSLFTILLAVGDSLRQKRLRFLRKALNEVAIITTPEQAFSNVADSLGQLNPDAWGDAIGQQVGSSLDRVIEQRLVPVFQDIGESLKMLRDIKEDQGQKVLENLIQSLRVEVLEPITDRLDESASMTREASKAVTQLHQELGGISKSLGTSIQTIQQFQQETLGQLKTFAESLEQTVSQFLSKSEAIFEQQSNTLETTGREASALMLNAKENLVTSLQNVDIMLQNTRITVQEELQHFRQDYQDSLQSFLSEQNNLLNDTLGQQRQGLAQVVVDLNDVFVEEAERRKDLSQEVDRSMSAIKGAAESVSKMAIATGMTEQNRLQELQHATRGMSEQLQQLERSYRQTLGDWKEHIEGYVQHSNQMHGQFFERADGAMATVCDKLLETASVLVAAKQENDNRNGANQ